MRHADDALDAADHPAGDAADDTADGSADRARGAVADGRALLRPAHDPLRLSRERKGQCRGQRGGHDVTRLHGETSTVVGCKLNREEGEGFRLATGLGGLSYPVGAPAAGFATARDRRLSRPLHCTATTTAHSAKPARSVSQPGFTRQNAAAMRTARSQSEARRRK